MIGEGRASIARWQVALRNGAGNQWKVHLVGPNGEEVNIRASTAVHANAIAQVVSSADTIRVALRKARTVLFQYADTHRVKTH